MALSALTGTPGTGKTSVARILEERGLHVCYLDELAADSGALAQYDKGRETWEVDILQLQESIPPERPLVLVGHYSHLLSPDSTIVLRCHPDILRERLEKRGWKTSKVRENLEAEALGVIVQEALSGTETFEIDTTTSPPEKSAQAVLQILEGEGQSCLAGKVDWSEVILSWY